MLEYKIVRTGYKASLTELTELMNEEAEQGWEFVTWDIAKEYAMGILRCDLLFKRDVYQFQHED